MSNSKPSRLAALAAWGSRNSQQSDVANKRIAPRPSSTAISTYAKFGVGLLLLGCIIAASNWPGTEVDYAASLSGSIQTRETGDQGATAFGLVVAGVGQLLLLVAIIGQGVRLGVQAAKELP